MSGLSSAREAANIVVKEDGTRVIPASRRPDGTWRKERRVRDGYVQQDEQPAYESRGRQIAKGPNLPPGFSPEDVQPKPMSKSAKKNAARKKNAANKQQQNTDVDDLADKAGDLLLKDNGSIIDAAKCTAPTAEHSLSASEGTAESGSTLSAEKKIKQLKKKCRQCQAIQAKLDEGQTISEDEQVKLQNLTAWEAEIATLEASISNAS